MYLKHKITFFLFVYHLFSMKFVTTYSNNDGNEQFLTVRGLSNSAYNTFYLNKSLPLTHMCVKKRKQ